MKARSGAILLTSIVAGLVAAEPLARAQSPAGTPTAPPPTSPRPAPASSPASGAATGGTASTANTSSAPQPAGVRVTMTLPQMPPTRTYCTFDVLGAGQSGDSITFEWDPLKPRSLVRQATLVLTNAAGTKVQVSCHAEAARHTIDANVNYAWRPERQKSFTAYATAGVHVTATVQAATADALPMPIKFRFCDPSNNPKEGCLNFDAPPPPSTSLPAGSPGGSSPPAPAPSAVQATAPPIEREAEIEFSKLPDLWPSTGGGPAALSAVVARAPALPLARSLTGLSDQALGELFQVIAEVVVEKAKSKGLKLAQAKLSQLLCEELASVPNLRKPDVKAPIFPRTCDAVRSVRLDDLAGAGRQLLHALAQDVVLRATWFITEQFGSTLRVYLKPTLVPDEATQKAIQDILSLSIEAAVDAAAGKHERLKSAGQRVLVALSRAGQAAWIQAGTSTEHIKKLEAVHAFSTALAILRDCHESGRCDQARLDWIMQDPSLFFDTTQGKTLSQALSCWPEARSFITTALKILSPPPETTESEQLRAALGLVFDMFDLFAGGASGRLAASNLSTLTGVDLADHDAMPVRVQLRLLRELLDAAVAQDLVRLSAAGMRLVAYSVRGLSIEPRYLQQFSQIAAAAGSYLGTYTSGREPSKEELAERREARKAALSALIDAQTQRSSRFGITKGLVLSVGGSIGVLGAGQWDRDGVFYDRARVQPNLAAGFALDWHLSETGIGLHLEAMPLNLGSYLALSDKPRDEKTVSPVAEPAPGDAISPSATLGVSYVVQSADLITFLGITAGYASKIGTDDEAVKDYSGFYLGGTLGAYIPFFDFN